MEKMIRRIALAMSCLLLAGAAVACTPAEDKPSVTPTDSVTPTAEEPTATPTEAPTATPTPAENEDYYFQGKVTKKVLENYLSRAVTLAGEQKNLDSMAKFIINTGAKYICRSACCWNPSASDYKTYEAQEAMMEQVHAQDPDVVFEACIFEYIRKSSVETIAIPAYVFEAFNMDPVERNFSYDAMCFSGGKNKDYWGKDQTIPDITKVETQMFFYYRACEYIKIGIEALHLGQIHLIGAQDTGWKCYTELCTMIRDFAATEARRGFVFLNAHTAGVIGSDGNLLLDFHMYPSRFYTDVTQADHAASEDNPQLAYLKNGYSDTIYGKSKGGTTYSGWSCDSLPYLVEFDNYGCEASLINRAKNNGYHVWGMDEITWFANQPASYRKDILQYAYYWMRYYAEGDGYIAMPGQRMVYHVDADGKVTRKDYYAYDPSYFEGGWGDEQTIKDLWAGKLEIQRDDMLFYRELKEEEEVASAGKPEGDVLKYTATISAAKGASPAYVFLKIADINFAINQKCYLEYDVYLEDDVPGLGAVDGICAEGPTIRDTAAAADQSGIGAHPKHDLTDLATGKWYHRTIQLNVGDLAGKTLSKIWLAAHPEESDGVDKYNGAHNVYYDNIVITDADGAVLFNIFTDEADLVYAAVDGNFRNGASATVSVVDLDTIK